MTAPEPALPGSYGEPPRGARLPAAAALGPVHLRVGDLERSVAFYQKVLGLEAGARAAGTASLAPLGGGAPLVVLHELPGARPVPPRGRLGLYHFAILVPDRPALGRFVRHLGDIGVRAGAGDHLVSEAFYLHDPDGLGIEVYADRPRETWRRIGRELMMATDPVDVADVVRAAGDTPWTGLPAGTKIGHLHFHVGDTEQASSFYGEGLGLDRMVWSYPGALFFGAGGYHHHVGVNTWAGAGAGPPPAGEARLLEWTVELPDPAAVAEAAERIRQAGFVTETNPAGIVARDPWGTAVRLLVSAAECRAPSAERS